MYQNFTAKWRSPQNEFLIRVKVDINNKHFRTYLNKCVNEFRYETKEQIFVTSVMMLGALEKNIQYCIHQMFKKDIAKDRIESCFWGSVCGDIWNLEGNNNDRAAQSHSDEFRLITIILDSMEGADGKISIQLANFYAKKFFDKSP